MGDSILIIDDNEEIRENTEEILKLAGYATYKACNGKEGLEIIHKHTPNLILCDIVMPVLDGYGVLRALENIPCMTGVPFIFMTANAEINDLKKGIDLGADGYLTKPFNGDELLGTVSSRLRKYNLIKKTFGKKPDSLNELISENNSSKEIGVLSERRNVKKIKKKELIFIEGDFSNFLYFITSGKVKIFKTNEFGKEYIISIHKTGDFFGYHALMEEGIHRESAMTIECTELALVPRQDFLHLLQSNNEIALKFIRTLSHSFVEAEERLLKLAYDSARKRVAEAIIFVSKKYLDDRETNLSFVLNRENISALSGISPESVSRNLTDLKEEGLIETANGNIRIIDFKRLEMLKN